MSRLIIRTRRVEGLLVRECAANLLTLYDDLIDIFIAHMLLKD